VGNPCVFILFVGPDAIANKLPPKAVKIAKTQNTLLQKTPVKA
jgi:hypothetical protein